MEAFDFEADGRTFTCSVEMARKPLAPSWWWFSVTGDRHRYAPFQFGGEDTEMTVRARVLSYYRDLLDRRGITATTR
ncbi:MAG: hypothetical protein ACYC2G_02205 [Gemmatimonadaceae bacterium]